ncbi:glycosyltransferase [Microbacterium sp. SMR1]|uniref:glycosyltransferase n=1 Tax=Microbacterium sp. SMR1 TaxID=1497340 RepID=UPI000DCEAE7D|nr:hypothetical protein DO944_14460 [Microbacterium sp. SMR1]
MNSTKDEKDHRPLRAVFVVNSDRAFWTHRSTWATYLITSGYEVHVLAPDTGHRRRIEGIGAIFHDLNLGREDVGALVGVTAASRIAYWLLRIRPQLVFLVQTAAYTLGWPAAIALRKTKFVRVAGGVGRALGLSAASQSRSARLVRGSLRLAARLPNVWTLFQLEGDRELFAREALATPSRSWVVPGTGIDTNLWSPKADDAAPATLTVGFVSRLYAEKGVYEFVDAARRLRDRGLRFAIVGAPDVGVRSSVSADEIEQWEHEGIIEWWGQRDDMVATFRALDLLVFPSRHPEGTPRTLIEAAACGVPAIVSDQEGCRAVVADGRSGWVLKSTSADEVAVAIAAVTSDRIELAAAGAAARSRAQASFSLGSTLSAVFSGCGINTAHTTGNQE